MMKLSEAIRLGATLRPQGFGQLFTTDGRTCALGAALESIGVFGVDIVAAVLPEAWDWIMKGKYNGPRGVTKQTWITNNAYSIIVYLNDHEEWSRERIADWVESLESQEDFTTQDTEGTETKESEACELSTVNCGL